MKTVTEKKFRPILFSSPMVRAFLAGTKTQTRRVVNPQPPSLAAVQKLSGAEYGWMSCADWGKPELFRAVGPVWAVRELMGDASGGSPQIKCPYGKVGDRLWVKETWAEHTFANRSGTSLNKRIVYQSDNEVHGIKWKSSRFMPRRYSRITLEITGVRVERLNEITNRDAEDEGVEQAMEITPGKIPKGKVGHRTGYGRSFVAGFKELWDKLNESRGYSFATNPWVFVIKFRRIGEAQT